MAAWPTSRSSTALLPNTAQLYWLRPEPMDLIWWPGSRLSLYSLPRCLERSCWFATGLQTEKTLHPRPIHRRWTRCAIESDMKREAKEDSSHERNSGFGARLPDG